MKYKENQKDKKNQYNLLIQKLVHISHIHKSWLMLHLCLMGKNCNSHFPTENH